MDDERYLIVKSYLRSIERDINNEKGQEEQLFFGQTLKSSWVNEGYINYLSRYSNNIIQFSIPKVIDVELNDANFKRVFEKYIFKYGGEHDLISEVDVYGRVQQELFPKIKDRVNLNRTLTSHDFGNLFTPIEIDFIGINGMPVAGQTIDAHFVSLTKAIELEGNQRGKYYVLGREPQHTTDQKNHQLWEHIRDSNFLDFVDVDEVGIVEEYIEKNDVRPFFAE